MREPRAEDLIYPMPTLEEVVAAGYPASYLESVAQQRGELIAKFNSDPEFRAQMIIEPLEESHAS